MNPIFAFSVPTAAPRNSQRPTDGLRATAGLRSSKGQRLPWRPVRRKVGRGSIHHILNLQFEDLHYSLYSYFRCEVSDYMQNDLRQNLVSARSSPAPSSFRELMAIPAIRARFDKVRQYFFLRESTFDMSSRCNLRCDGCYYYSGDKQFTPDNLDTDAWRELMQAEKTRGITYVVLAGAEPALVPSLLEVCFEEQPLGAIATNGVIRIPESIGYQLHISVWGNDSLSAQTRHCDNLLERQLKAYEGDPRAVFVYTFTRDNIDSAGKVVETLVQADAKVTFNMFSATSGYDGELRHSSSSLLETRKVMLEMLERYPDNVLFSPYSAMAHTHRLGLHDVFDCSYPRCNESEFLGLGRSFRQYRTDLTWDRDAACCVPDTDCADCRHYAAGSAVVTARLHRHAIDEERLRGWLDYVDTYLAVWVMGYEKSPNLLDHIVAPPGFEIEPVERNGVSR